MKMSNGVHSFRDESQFKLFQRTQLLLGAIMKLKLLLSGRKERDEMPKHNAFVRGQRSEAACKRQETAAMDGWAVG